MQSSDVSSLKKILVENWENAFHVTETSHEISIYVETDNTNEDSGLWNYIPSKMGKRFIMIFRTPVGYIDAFLRSERKK